MSLTMNCPKRKDEEAELMVVPCTLDGEVGRRANGPNIFQVAGGQNRRLAQTIYHLKRSIHD